MVCIPACVASVGMHMLLTPPMAAIEWAWLHMGILLSVFSPSPQSCVTSINVSAADFPDKFSFDPFGDPLEVTPLASPPWSHPRGLRYFSPCIHLLAHPSVSVKR